MEMGTIAAINKLKQMVKGQPEKPKLKTKWLIKDQYLTVLACLKEEKRQKHITEEEYAEYRQTITDLYERKENK